MSVLSFPLGPEIQVLLWAFIAFNFFHCVRTQTAFEYSRVTNMIGTVLYLKYIMYMGNPIVSKQT